MKRTLLCVAVLLVAGCLGNGQDNARTPDQPPELATQAQFVCPRGGPNGTNPCVDSFAVGSLAPDFLQVAINPSDANQWAILGIGIAEAPDAQEPQRQLARPGSDYLKTFLWFTANGGAEWARRDVPVMLLDPSATSQAVRHSTTLGHSLAWGPDGTLHVLGTVENEVEEGVCQCPDLGLVTERSVFLISTSDLGRTWTAPVGLGRFAVDPEPRMAVVGDVWVVVLGTGSHEGFLLSSDQGATWEPATGRSTCPPGGSTATDPRLNVVGHLVYFRCRGQAASAYFELNTTDKSYRVLDGPLSTDDALGGEQCVRARLRTLGTMLVMVGDDCPDVMMWLRPLDGNWSAPISVFNETPPAGYTSRQSLLTGADATGQHISIMVYSIDSRPSAQPFVGEGPARAMNQIVFDLQGQRQLQAATMTPSGNVFLLTTPVTDATIWEPFANDGNRTLYLLGVNGASFGWVQDFPPAAS